MTGRFFVKQDHQGPPGFAHGGVLAAALDEAMALAVAQHALAYTARLEVDLERPAPVGTFVALEARVERHEGRTRWAVAAARSEAGAPLASARAVYVEPR